MNLGTIERGETTTLRMEWLPAQNRVDLQRDNGAVQSISYDLVDSVPPNPNKVFGVEANVSNCTAAPRPFTEMTVLTLIEQ